MTMIMNQSASAAMVQIRVVEVVESRCVVVIQIGILTVVFMVVLYVNLSRRVKIVTIATVLLVIVVDCMGHCLQLPKFL